MKLSEFLDQEREKILAEAEAFAATMPALRGAVESELRDHLPQLLHTIRADLDSPQTVEASVLKSQGKAPAPIHETAAQVHGVLRARRGLNVSQLVAEYRALRASVLRLWAASPATSSSTEEIARFNEAVDQAVAESVEFFSAEVEKWRQIFLGVLGHDLRAPLNAMALTTELLALSAPPSLQTHVMTLSRGVSRIQGLLDSLLEYSRASLGMAMVIARTPTDLGAACAEEVALLSAAFPEARIEMEKRGDVHGEFDASRIREALSNLVANAVRHGAHASPIPVIVEGDPLTVSVSVDNTATLSDDEMERLFDPLRQGAGQQQRGQHLGLGLFITRQIARAHGGDVHGSCRDGRVRFTMTLPKAPQGTLS